MKLYICSIVLNDKYMEGQEGAQEVLQRFLDTKVQAAVGFRGEVKESWLVNSGMDWLNQVKGRRGS